LHFSGPAGVAREPVTADVAVACDGINSTIRQQFYPLEGSPVYHGINMWRGVTRAKPFWAARAHPHRRFANHEQNCRLSDPQRHRQ